MGLGLIFSVVGVVLLVVALLRLAVIALPLWVGLTLVSGLLHIGAGGLVAIPLGFAGGVAAWFAGRMLIAADLPGALRAGIVVLFATPAGLAGYSVVSGLMRLGGAGPVATMAAAAIGAVVIAPIAMLRLAGPTPGGGRIGMPSLARGR